MKESTKKLIQSFFPNKSAGTLKAYASDLDTFSSYLGTDSAREALELLFSLPQNRANLVVLHFKVQIDDSGMKPASINRKLSALRSIVKEAHRKRLISWTLDVANEKNDNDQTEILLDRNKIQKIMTFARSQKKPHKAARDYAILRLLYDLALKRSCIATLQLDDLSIDTRQLKVCPDGEPDGRVKILPTATLNALKAWLEIRGDSAGPLFQNMDRAGKGEGISSTSIYRIVQGLGEKLDIKITPEDIRKTAISEAVANAGHLDISDHEILAFTDHKQVSSLKQYRKKQSRSQMMISSLISKN